jgi:hypothetical protein
MIIPEIVPVETLFAVIVFVAVLAIMVETYNEVVVAAAMLVGIWKLFQFTGVSLVLAVGLIMLTAGLKLWVDFLFAVLDAGTVEPRDATTLLDAVLTGRDDPEDPERRQHRLWAGDRETEELDTDVDSIDDYRR